MQAAGSFPTFRSLIVRNRARQSPSTFLADFEHEVKSALAEAATPDEGRDLRVAYCLLFHKICTFAVPSRNAKQKCGWSIGNGAELNALFVMRSPLYRQTLEWTRFIEWLSAQGAGPVSTLSVQQPDMVIAARSERDWTSAEAESNQQYRQGLVAATARQRAIPRPTVLDIWLHASRGCTRSYALASEVRESRPKKKQEAGRVDEGKKRRSEDEDEAGDGDEAKPRLNGRWASRLRSARTDATSSSAQPNLQGSSSGPNDEGERNVDANENQSKSVSSFEGLSDISDSDADAPHDQADPSADTMSALIDEQANAIRASREADSINATTQSSPGLFNSSPPLSALTTPPHEESLPVLGARKPDIEHTRTHFQANESA